MRSNSIKQILSSLTPAQRDQLMYAFENEFSQRIVLSDNSFIGVNVQLTDEIEVIETAGLWTYAIVN